MSNWTDLRREVLECRACAELAAGRQSVVFGSGGPGAKSLFVGEAPGAREDAVGEPFVGPSGQLLDQVLDEVGLSRDAVAVTNVVKCRPPGNRTPTREEAARCRRWLDAQVAILDPVVVCTLGATATAWALGRPVRLSDVRGRPMPYDGRLLVATYHPAAAIRGGRSGPTMDALRSDIALVAELAATQP